MTAATATRKTEAKVVVATNIRSVLTRVATALGKESRKSLAETEGAHAAYIKAKPDVQKEMRHVWVNAYMAAHLNVSIDIADTLRQAPRLGAKAKDGVKPRDRTQQQAYDRARKLFSFHISRDDSRGKPGAGRGEPVVIDTDFAQSVRKFCSKQFEAVNAQTLEWVAAQIAAMAKVLAKQEKAQA